MTLFQPRDGYRAGVDPVLLAAAVPAQSGQSLLDLGCGVGAVGLCVATRVPGLALRGVDLLAENVVLAARNGVVNDIAFDSVQGDVAALPADLRQRSFDHVTANPPYFRRSAGPIAATAHRDQAMAGDLPLAVWVDCGIRRLAPGGRLSLIIAAERLPETLSAIGDRLGELRVLPIAGRAGRAAGRAIVTGRKDSRAPFALLAPLVLHAGPAHRSDAEDYTPEVAAILRDAAPLLLKDRS
ncbi:MAG: methyltransferase [Pseudomonadota bacterium]